MLSWYWQQHHGPPSRQHAEFVLAACVRRRGMYILTRVFLWRDVEATVWNWRYGIDTCHDAKTHMRQLLTRLVGSVGR
eukprot:354893-Chlamydomonas_euryale.AAC.5